jgi:hypothetical protein
MREYVQSKGVITMNQFFYESRGKEKVKGLLDEGLRGQAIRRSGVSKAGFAHNLPRIALMLLGILGLMGILVR